MRLQLGKASLAALLAAGLVGDFLGLGPPAGAADRDLRSGVAKTGFDAKVRPQDDLFRHVNGSGSPRPRSRPIRPLDGSLHQAPRQRAEADLRAIIEDVRQGRTPPAGSEARKVGDLYASFMDEATAEELGLEPIKGDLARIDAIADKAGFVRLLAELQREGVDGPVRRCSSTPTPSSRTATSSTSPGRDRPARRVVLSRREVQADPRGVRRPRREDVRAGRPARARGGGRRRSWPWRPGWPSATGTASRAATTRSPTTRRTARRSTR